MLSSIWEQFINLSLIVIVLRMLPPILLGALGGLMTDRAGVINIGIEGLMLVSAFSSIAIGAWTNNWFLGVVGGTAASMLVSYAMAFFNLKMKVDIIVIGFAVNIFGAGITVLLMSILFGSHGNYIPATPVSIPAIVIPFIDQIPVIGKLLSGHNLMVWISILAVVFCYFIIYHTPYGFHLRATGEEPSAARSLGIRVERIQYSALIWSGFFSGLAGAYLSMGMTSMFVRDMTAGTGFLALAVVIFGNKNPFGILFGSLVFALAQAVTLVIETAPGNAVPSQLIKMVPYTVTIIALVVYALRKRSYKKIRTSA
ncbi:simple sugar transport system permease protein [Paenibacillus castaneae]|uniref:ABC transporter permease n=1 Tax=Paenibacillus castaneae TaxID=474957 RepID=UPI000C9AB86E|nr:ABC transporter permease [Paenibacillus castaneae]NIK76520.1 simple sugar transport system permease protein [Paenibacillus castaneae]